MNYFLKILVVLIAYGVPFVLGWRAMTAVAHQHGADDAWFARASWDDQQRLRDEMLVAGTPYLAVATIGATVLMLVLP